MRVSYGPIRPPHWPQQESSIQSQRMRRIATRQDLENGLFTTALYTRAPSRRLECDSIEEVLNGQLGDRGTMDDDWV